MKASNKFLSYCGLIAALGSAQASSSSDITPLYRKWGLKELLHHAKSHQSAHRQAVLELEKAKFALGGARAQFLPQLQFNSGLLFSQQAPEPALKPGGAWNSDARLTLEQNIYDNGVSLRRYQRADLETQRAEMNLLARSDTFTSDVIAAYLKCLRLEKIRDISKRKIALLDRQFKLLSSQYRQGLKTRRDFQRLDAELQKNHLSLARLDENIFEAYQGLSSLLGDPELLLVPGTLVTLSGDNLVDQAILLKKSVATIQKNEIPELVALGLNIKIFESHKSEARRNHWPKLAATASLSYGASTFVGAGALPWSEGDRFETQVGLSLKWRLWDWGLSKAEIGMASADYEMARIRAHQRTLELKNENAVATFRIERQQRAVELQRKLRNLEIENYQQLERDYREGRAQYLDLINALESTTQAEIVFEQDANDFYMALVEALKLKGALYDTITQI